MINVQKPLAEGLFEEYLRSQGLDWGYESLAGWKKPDYVVCHSTGRCIFEIKELGDPDPLPTGGFDPDRPVRKKIRRAREQFREYKDHCCNLVVFNKSVFGSADAGVVLAAAFGPGFQQDGRDYSRVDPAPPRYRFVRKSELPPHLHSLSEPMLTRDANRTFSALVVLARYELNELHLEVWRRLYVRQQAGESLAPGESLRTITEIGSTFARSPRFAGTVRVIVIENCYARIPFPQDLFRGPFDQRWGWEGEWCTPVWLGTTLRCLNEEGVPFHLL